jgi:hypothetical protein
MAPAFNFSERFAGLVAQGVKRQTIRGKRKNRPRVGQVAYCFAGMRTRKCRRLGAWPIVAVRDVGILECGGLVDGLALGYGGLEALARADGFVSWKEMQNWFRGMYGLPFCGDLVVWGNAGGEAPGATGAEVLCSSVADVCGGTGCRHAKPHALHADCANDACSIFAPFPPPCTCVPVNEPNAHALAEERSDDSQQRVVGCLDRRKA